MFCSDGGHNPREGVRRSAVVGRILLTRVASCVSEHTTKVCSPRTKVADYIEEVIVPYNGNRCVVLCASG